ncbi:hypothetical protein [Mesorhizobium amorphae]|uniref:hypothetical protein n=1 Tax=Mesorhizobium amorphae TaxID=71433 RepID=UPI00177CD4A7|nr:hypothetical protein [Mesorhizobium amorphae]
MKEFGIGSFRKDRGVNRCGQRGRDRYRRADQFDDKSQTIAQAIDDFLLDLMTLVFVIESTQEMFHYPARLAHMKLTKVRLLLAS